MKHFDAIIIGTGAAGGIVACVLAEAGKHVLLLERGAALSFADIGRDHLRNQRLAIYGNNAGPDVVGNPLVFVDPHGRSRVVKPYELDYHNNVARARFNVVIDVTGIARLLARTAHCEPMPPLRAILHSEGVITEDHNFGLSGPMEVWPHPLFGAEGVSAVVLAGR